MSVFCTNCGAAIPDGMKFCTNCGTAVSAVPVNNANNMGRQSAPQGETQSMWDGDSTMSVWNSSTSHTHSQPEQNYSQQVSNQPTQNYSQPSQNYGQSARNYAQQAQNTNPGWDGDSTIGMYGSDNNATQSLFGRQVSQAYSQPAQNYGQSAQNYNVPAQNYNQPVQNSNKVVNNTANSPVQTQTSVGAETYEYSEIAKKTMTFGILGCALFWTVAGGIVFGILALKSSKKFNGNSIGLTNNKNKIGKILGIVGMALSGVLVIVGAAFGV